MFDVLDLLLDSEPHAAAMNMAIDEALLRSGTRPLLRAYRWTRPSVSFGYFEKWAPLLARFPEHDCVRRWTGGGVVLHGDDFTYSLILPANAPAFRLTSGALYCGIHTALAAALAKGGIPATVAEGAAPGGAAGTAAATAPCIREGETPAGHPQLRPGDLKSSNACFDNPVHADLLAAGRKIAGAGQRRTRAGLLHQGSVQGVPIPGKLAELLAAALAPTVNRRPLSAQELDTAATLARSRYATAEWTARF